MTDQDYKAFAMKMGELSLAYRMDPSVPLFKLYYRRLIPYSLDAVVHAVDTAIDTMERFPTISKLREFARSYRKPWTAQEPKSDNLIAEFSDAEMQQYQGKSVDELYAMMMEKFGPSERGDNFADKH